MQFSKLSLTSLTGISYHLRGVIAPDQFKEGQNATYEDVLFAPTKLPEINVKKETLFKDVKEFYSYRRFEAYMHASYI